MNMRRIISVIAGTVVTGALTGAAVAATRATDSVDPRVRQCGVGGDVAAVFDLDRANRIWQYLPAMKQPPELVDNVRPASVVVYKGQVTGMVMGPAGITRDQATDAVCFILSSGERIVFVNVSRSGFVAP
jgi:hypothetical protein